ncbi:MAG TPA: type II toxin-antitoxin system RelE/ParE family toxin [Bacteroidetes bacterium]|nr:type II toxin-antitoxin system RelE/ParE family toxin [Bacteroidota bacterium]
MRVRFTQKSRDQLKLIYEYYKDLSKGKYGRQIRARILTKALKLKDFPFLGQEEENLKYREQGHRYLIEGNYKIIYRVIDDEVLIIHIFDTRQNPDKMIVA